MRTIPYDTIHTLPWLETCRLLPGSSVRLILIDPPYGVTANAWDKVIDFTTMRAEFMRVLKPNGAIVVTACPPFDKLLCAAWMDIFSHEWIWQKDNHSDPFNAKRKPLTIHEQIEVFARMPPVYNPQMRVGPAYQNKLKGRISDNYGGGQHDATIYNDGLYYPKSILYFPRDKPSLHPTQKPIALWRYLVRTYSNPGELVFDPTCGCGTTAVAAKLEGRRYVVGDLDPKWTSKTRSRLLFANENA